MHSNTAFFSPVSERIARIRDECPYFKQWARAISAACWRVIPAIGMAPPISLPATVGVTQPDSADVASNPSNKVTTRRIIVTFSPCCCEQCGDRQTMKRWGLREAKYWLKYDYCNIDKKLTEMCGARLTSRFPPSSTAGRS